MEKDKTNSKKAVRKLQGVTGKRSARTDVINDTEERVFRECGYPEKMGGVLWNPV